jgi:hypothetical protein
MWQLQNTRISRITEAILCMPFRSSTAFLVMSVANKKAVPSILISGEGKDKN